LFTASFRSDGSSRFAPGKKWGYFPSGAVAWRFTQENFMKPLRFINDGKLRATYGLTGNNRVNDFAYLSVITLPINSSYVINNNYVRGSNVTTIGNPDLKWETTEQTDLGIDLSFLKSRINLTADVYRKKTRDLLLFANLPLSLGYDNAFKNIGSIQNEGLELTLNTVNFKSSKFSWNSNFNISFYRNKVLALAENQSTFNSTVNWDFNYSGTPAYNVQLGQPLGLMFGYIWDGVYQYSDFNRATSGSYILKENVTTNGNNQALIQPGDIKYRDINGDNVVDAQDYTVIGRGLPVHAGGFTNNFQYKNFDLSILFQWSYGNNILNVNRMVFEGNAFNRVGLNQFASYENRWSPTNQESNIPRTRGIPVNSPYSSRYVEDGSYIRLKTLNVGYRLPATLLKKAKIRELRVYLATQNLLTWTNYSGFDPEVNSYSSALTPGFDYSAYPRSRTFVLGANISF
jgi:TonB-linked SusC/RagA family outer membrane protein